MLPSGRVVFGQMDEVVFGKPAAEAIAGQVDRLGATHVFLMVSNLSIEPQSRSTRSAGRLATAVSAASIGCRRIRRGLR